MTGVMREYIESTFSYKGLKLLKLLAPAETIQKISNKKWKKLLHNGVTDYIEIS